MSFLYHHIDIQNRDQTKKELGMWGGKETDINTITIIKQY